MIEVKNLIKNYGFVKAVRDITFSVAKGEVLGFLGPNGAGKTTTMKILTCFMLPTSGEVNIAGFDIYKDSIEIRKRIGYLPETAPLYFDLQVDEFLEYVAELRGIPSNEKNNRIKEVVEVCGLKDVYVKFIGELSKGYKQRVGLAQALIHKPDILILDEPTIGLDPNQIIEIRNLIKTIGKEKTVILSTHILSEVEATCNRVIIINNGQLIADGTPSGIGRTERGKTYIIKIKTDNKEETLYRYKSADFIEDVKEISYSDNNVVQLKVFLKSKDFDAGIELFKFSANNSFNLIEMKEEEESLEDVFHKLTK
ncbi:MAG TPA: ATP-binding cassette domain-containing protein [bacterium]|nr:ATP-binding cassette domain-containing protein [bacterium]HOL48799.1 ATP-binding cassette domain-containing protein [bacterium]HPQ19233.1 ATP-binding cassette domain-containing protein [bacterium]